MLYWFIIDWLDWDISGGDEEQGRGKHFYIINILVMELLD